MAKRSTHPGRRLFDFLGGRLDSAASMDIELHLAECPECRFAAEIVRSFRSVAGRSGLTPDREVRHPDFSELASFFYRGSAGAPASNIAAHVAVCRQCADAIAIYAQAERAAAESRPGEVMKQAVPAAAWAMVHDWEQSAFAVPRDVPREMDNKLLGRVARLFHDRSDELQSLVGSAVGEKGETPRAQLVPVLIVDRSGEFRNVEIFERVADPDGRVTLSCREAQSQFENKRFNALIYLGEHRYAVVSELIRHNSATLKVENSGHSERLGSAAYFIIED